MILKCGSNDIPIVPIMLTNYNGVHSDGLINNIQVMLFDVIPLRSVMLIISLRQRAKK